MPNKISKTWDGRIVDDHNNLYVVEPSVDATFYVMVGNKSILANLSVGNKYVMERHNRMEPVLVTSTVWNAMQKACANYNKVVQY